MICAILVYVAIGATVLFMCLRDGEIWADLRRWPKHKLAAYLLLSIFGWPLILFASDE